MCCRKAAVVVVLLQGFTVAHVVPHSRFAAVLEFSAGPLSCWPLVFSFSPSSDAGRARPPNSTSPGCGVLMTLSPPEPPRFATLKEIRGWLWTCG